MSIVTRNSRASVLALAAALIIPAGLLAAQAPADVARRLRRGNAIDDPDPDEA